MAVTVDKILGKPLLHGHSTSDISGISDYLLASGATTGATSEAQPFTNGVVTGVIKPVTNSTQAVQIQNASGSSIINVDTTNGRMSIGGAGVGVPAVAMHIYQPTDNSGIRINGFDDMAGENFALSINASGTGNFTATRNINFNNAAAVVAADIQFTPNRNVYFNTATSGSVFVRNSSNVIMHSFAETGAIVFNENGSAVGLRVEGDTEANLFVTDGVNDRVGLYTASPSYNLSLGGNATRTVGMNRHTTANTAGNSLTIVAGGATASATDKNGGDLILASGTSTGTGFSSVKIQAVTAGTTGTTDRTVATIAEFGNSKMGFFGATPVVKQTGGVATAGASYGATEQTMLQSVYDAMRNYGLLT